MTTEEKMLKARTSLILDHPFFGCLAMRLRLKEDSDSKTLATNGKELYYNPSYIESLSLQQTIGVLAHEVMHLALGHHWRQDNREARRWNIACDYAINGSLVDAGFSLPASLDDPAYHSLSAEEIYNRLPITSPKPQGQSDSSDNQQQQDNDIDPGCCGAVIPPEDERRDESKAEWKAAVNQAKQISIGTLPANILREIEQVLNPPLPWYVLLRDFVEKSARNDYNWNKPSRRYFSSGIILPSLVSEEIPEIVVVIDTSGSISKEQLSQFVNELSAILEAYNTKIRVIYCDTTVKKEEEFNREDLPLRLEPVGGGGTKFAPAFEYVDEKGYTPSCLLYFTDLYSSSFPAQEPNYPTLWITTSEDKEAPFGKTIRFIN